MSFQNPLEEVHMLASPNPTVYDQVHFHYTFESAEQICPHTMLLDRAWCGRQAGKIHNFSKDCVVVICFNLKKIG